MTAPHLNPLSRALTGWLRMLSIDGAERPFIRVRAEGVLTGADYAAFEPSFAEALAGRSLPVPLLLDLTDFRGWTLAGFLRDVGFDLRHRNTFSRIAVLGDRPWHRWSTWVAAPVFSAKLRFFEPDAEALAKAWLSQAHEVR